MIDLDKIKQNLLPRFLPMTCYKHPNLDLIFYPNHKCASSTYRLLFQKQQWTLIDTSDIKWHKDTVFAHIRDPLVRHRKGIVEGICNYFTEAEDLFLNPVGAKFLTNITIVEPHSYTIEKWFGIDNAVSIHWIPIDTDIDHVQETFDFLKKQGAPVAEDIKRWFLSLPRANESNSKELKLYNMLMAEKTPAEILRYIDFDRCLYGQVVGSYGFEPKNYRQRVEALKQTGLSELDAQKIADTEVASGEYVNWNTHS